MTRKTARTVLYIDDEYHSFKLELIVNDLKRDYDVMFAKSCDQALAILRTPENSIRLIILDIRMPPGDACPDDEGGRSAGISFARNLIHKYGFNIPIICYTQRTDAEAQNYLRQIGIQEFIPKTGSAEEYAILKGAINKYLPDDCA